MNPYVAILIFINFNNPLKSSRDPDLIIIFVSKYKFKSLTLTSITMNRNKGKTTNTAVLRTMANKEALNFGRWRLVITKITSTQL